MMKPLLIVMSRWCDLFFPTPAENILSKQQCWKNDPSMAESCKSKSKLNARPPEGMSMTSMNVSTMVINIYIYIYLHYMIVCMYTVCICRNYMSIWKYVLWLPWVLLQVQYERCIISLEVMFNLGTPGPSQWIILKFRLQNACPMTKYSMDTDRLCL